MTNPSEPKYKVFIHLPFPRGSFIDPPPNNWSSSKETELWQLLNATPRGQGVDWELLAQRFETTSSFLLQQAAWLYERQLEHVRENLSFRHRLPSVAGQGQTPGSAGGQAGGQAMRRVGSGQGNATAVVSVRPPSALSIRAKVSAERVVVTPEGQRRVPYSRTTSATTVTQFQRSPTIHGSPRQKPRTLSIEKAPPGPFQDAVDRSIGEPEDSSSSEESSIAQSRIGRRQRFPPSNSKGKAILNVLASAEEDSDEAPDFLPFPAQNLVAKGKTSSEGLSSTLTTFKSGNSADKAKPRSKTDGSASSSGTLSSPNQASSQQSFSSPRDLRSPSDGSRGLSALSPRHRQLAKDESEGTPSMGSSFSDLDDASISRSAMEEAMAREIKAGKGSLGVASRLTGIIRNASNTGAGGSGARRP